MLHRSTTRALTAGRTWLLPASLPREYVPKTSLGRGLFIVREIVLAHGGTIAVESTAEAGTVFTIRLPRPAG